MFEERRVNARCAHDRLARFHRTAGEIGCTGSGLGGDQQAGGEIPGLEMLLEVRVHSAARDMAQVDRRCPEPTYVPNVREHRADT